MNKCKVKHVFAGGNTTNGFISFYEDILKQEDANHIFCIKGGPGVGKSSFMKKIGSKMTEKNYQIEYVHCSSDPNSLDAVLIPELKVLFLDGTSPHVVDPKNPGAVDEVLNFGEFWDEAGIKANRENIIKTNAVISDCFRKAYQYLRAAKEVYKTYEMTENKALNQEEYHKLCIDLVKDVFESVPVTGHKSCVRSFFSFGLTPLGITEYRDTVLCKAEYRYVFKESVGASSEQLMNELKNAAIKRGYNVECYYSPLKIEKIEDLLIPDLGLAFSVNHQYNPYRFEHNKVIDLTALLNQKTLESYQDQIAEDKELFELLLYKGLNYINKAKDYHDRLEAYYIPNINFADIDRFLDKTLERILKYAK